MKIDLKRIGAGKKLIRQIVSQPVKAAPWSIANQRKAMSQTKNTRPKK